MKKNLIATCVFGLLVTSAVRADENGWQRYTLPSGKFDVLLPTTPLEHKETQRTPFGNQEVRIAMALDADTQVGYFVGSIEMPGGLKAEIGKGGPDPFDALAYGFVMGVKGKLVSKQKMTIAGYPGLEIKATMNDGEGELHGRLCLVDGQVYILAIMHAKGSADLKGATRFFESFRPVDAPRFNLR
jgi:hypothetical protein